MSESVTCCLCGTQSGEDWFKDGFLRVEVNGNGKGHFACPPCREDGMSIFKHAALWPDGGSPCCQPAIAQPAKAAVAMIDCPDCDGFGYDRSFSVSRTCKRCSGNRKIPKE